MTPLQARLSAHLRPLLGSLALSAAALSPLSPFSPLQPSEALACGGFFCNANLPVNQSAERVVFARAEGQIHMHVQVTYQGPPTEFGWLLPAHPAVETAISSEAFFSALDRLYGPRFQLNYQYGDSCQFFQYEDAELSPPQANNGSDGGVQVLSREAIGPYDRAILLAESVQDLRAWLDENSYQIPEDLDPKLQPYIDLGLAFVAIKLLPGLDAGDIVPLRLSFPGDRPSIPIIPTSVAADPDMGVIVHVLDQHRAVPVNYRHVRINEASIDWRNSGDNYADVVSQAVDEAGGRAFVTDYAGAVGDQLSGVLQPYSDEVLAQVSASATLFEVRRAISDFTNPDLHRVLGNLVTVPEDQDPSQYFRCPECYGDDQPIDGPALAAALRAEMNEPYQQINAVIATTPYLTRLYSTLSADEMDNDPMFSINPDLEDVSNVHVADAQVSCDEETGEERETTITLADGRSFVAERQEPTRRQGGETVRGADVPAAAAIEQMFEAGQPEVISERTPDEMTPVAGAEVEPSAGAEVEPSAGAEAEGASAKERDEGCEQAPSSTPLWLLSLLSLLGVVARLARREERV